MKPRPLVALDIGSTKVACAAGFPRTPDPGIELLGASLQPYPSITEGWWVDPLMVSSAIERALDEAAGTWEVNQAHVSISHPQLLSEHVRVSIHLADESIPIRMQDLERLKVAALNQLLGIDREPLVVERLSCMGNGFEGIRDPRGLSATRLSGDFHVVTMPIAVRQRIVQVVESAGLEVASLKFSMMAAAAACPGLNCTDRFLMIDVGGSTVSLGLFVEGRLHAAAPLRWGTLSLAQRIASMMNLTIEQAMPVCLEASSRQQDLHVLVAEPLEELAKAMHALLEGRPRPERVYLSGRGALIDGFAEWVEQTLGMVPSFCRSPQVSTLGELSGQVGLSHAIGLLEIAAQEYPSLFLHFGRSPYFLQRLLDRTKTLLTEYF